MCDIARLEDLVDEQLGGIHFVQDYVELYFDGPIVRCLQWPILVFNGKRIASDMQGYRDEICQMIGTQVDEVEIIEGDCIKIVLRNGWLIEVPIDTESSSYPESAHFVPGIDKPVQVF